MIGIEIETVRETNSVVLNHLRNEITDIEFNDVGYTFFNTNGQPDITTNSSTTRDDFIEHEYSAKDLADFNAFQIKIRMRGTDSTNPPIIKRLRVVATG